MTLNNMGIWKDISFFRVTYSIDNDRRSFLIANAYDEGFTLADVLPVAKDYLRKELGENWDGIVVGIKECRGLGAILWRKE